MRLLLDTHILVWMIEDPDGLTTRERAMIARASRLVISVATIWELRIKWHTRDRTGRRKGPISPDAALAFLSATGMELAALEGEDCVAPLDPPLAHRDPFDEILLVHAKRLKAVLLTRDGKLLDHPLVAQL